MFCPKCGAQLPDQAKFCASCGATMQAKAPGTAAPAGTPNQGVPGAQATFHSTGGGVTIAGKSMSVMTLASLILAAIALIFSLMPWFYTNSTYQNLSSFASYISGSSSYELAESYPVWQLMFIGEAANEVDELDDELGSLYSSVSSSSSGRAQAVELTNPEYTPISVSFFFMLYFVGWLVGFLLALIGAIVALTGKAKSSKLMVVGLIILALVALIYTINYTGGMTALAQATMPTNAVICFLAAIVAVVCAIAGRKQQA